jgi:hypothetical protein
MTFAIDIDEINYLFILTHAIYSYYVEHHDSCFIGK